MELHEIREEIRQIDEEMAELFVRRMEAVRKVAAYKNQRGLPVLDREQEARVYREFLQETMDISKRWQVYLIQRKRDGMQC